MYKILLLVTLLYSAYSNSALGNSKPVVLIMGDSISAAYGMQSDVGWVALVAEKLKKTCPNGLVINASISGETTVGGVRRFDAVLEDNQPDIVIIELGGNDGLRGYPLGNIETNLRQMAVQANDNGAKLIIAGMRIPPNYGNAYAEAFHQIYYTVAAEHDASLVPFVLQGVGTRPELMQADGIHPTAAAQPYIVDNVWPVLEPILDC